MSYPTQSTKERFHFIMFVLKGSQDKHLTSKQICEGYLKDRVTTSDVGSTGQILNVLALAGIVEKIQVQRSANRFSTAYKLICKHVPTAGLQRS